MPESAQPEDGSPASAGYEILRSRLSANAARLGESLEQLDANRRQVFGSVGYAILQGDRINTPNNCVPRDMAEIGHDRFLFGFNVRFGLKGDVGVSDVFVVFRRNVETGTFHEEEQCGILDDPAFLSDFQRIHRVYQNVEFTKFSVSEGYLFMVFRTGTAAGDMAVFRWEILPDGLRYADGRAETEYRRIGFPPSHHFSWTTPDRDAYRYGDYPHISIDDRIFVECTDGDLTIKIEDNTSTGEGVYAETVDDARQKVDDADIGYAILGHLILLRIRPYKEEKTRYLIFNEKTSEAVRADAIGHSCAPLPGDQGLVFADGFYLSTGKLRLFESNDAPYILERTIHSPNGEDSLFVFYSRTCGEYVLMPYRVIQQKIEERISCHGFSLFPNGQLLLFRSDDEPRKHHAIQLRQTPFYQTGQEPEPDRTSPLSRLSNRDVVAALSEANEILSLARREDPYHELYADIVRRCGAVLDAYPWLDAEEGCGTAEALRELRETADRAVDEFDNVLRLRQEAAAKLTAIRKRRDDQEAEIRRATFHTLDSFVENLAALRTLTGDISSHREVRYIDTAALDKFEQSVAAATEELSRSCVDFLLKPEALLPYQERATSQLEKAPSLPTVAAAEKLESEVSATAGELEMLIGIINSLQIDDATETTRILDGITAIYTTVNQARGAIKNRRRSLAAAEGAARFAARMKLLGQSAASYLDLCDSPDKCEDYLNRLSVQIEEMEGEFADFDEFLPAIAERRAELHEAFEQRRVALIEARSRRASSLLTAGERILRVIHNRLNTFSSDSEIHSYLASDPMVAKVRETIASLHELGDPLKAEDLSTRLKTAGQEAVRQLRDRTDLAGGGQGLIRIGRHEFHVNPQPLDVTIVLRDGTQCLHLSGTRFFEPIDDPDLNAARHVWEQELISENQNVYRSETLARRILHTLESNGGIDALESLRSGGNEAILEHVREFSSALYQEGYTRGIHDHDAALFLEALIDARLGLGLARFHPTARAAALVFWGCFCPAAKRSLWNARLEGLGRRHRLLAGDPTHQAFISDLRSLGRAYLAQSPYPEDIAPAAAEYLFYELSQGGPFLRSAEAATLETAFRQHLVSHNAEHEFQAALDALADDPTGRLELIRDWLHAFAKHPSHTTPPAAGLVEECAAVLFLGDTLPFQTLTAESSREITGLKGAHPRIQDGACLFDYLDFQSRLDHFEREVVPHFRRFHERKNEIIRAARDELRPASFTPQVLTTFVRNQLIDRVYLPLVGDNLAKQMGAAGDSKRTDRSGLLLLVSPPGYGKTTLLEYLASRLGIHFVKINGPALGFQTTSLDPAEAPNAAAREEIVRLNLALEMGDNILLCVDDIQHCSSEFLQKFISLCDAQRRIEGVWRGRANTYDLRGRKVVVAMAGNPYTETGQRFRIPDMLSNRADTYNLGDIVGSNDEWFKASYIENAATSNPVIAPVAGRSLKDLRAFLRAAESGDAGPDPSSIEGGYSRHDTAEILSVLKKLVTIRDTVLAVNLEYIRSAAQSDEFRTEPPFKLQGSYRNMNRLAEKVAAVMNDQEVLELILDHYRNESQTLTADTEANLLKLRELLDILTPEESARWEEIKTTFRRNQLTRSSSGDDPVGRVVGQLSAFGAGLDNIRDTLSKGLETLATPPPTPEPEATPPPATPAPDPDNDARLRSILHECEMIHATLSALQDLSIQQRTSLEKSRAALAAAAKKGSTENTIELEVELADGLLTDQQRFLEEIQKAIAARKTPAPDTKQPNALESKPAAEIKPAPESEKPNPKPKPAPPKKPGSKKKPS